MFKAEIFSLKIEKKYYHLKPYAFDATDEQIHDHYHLSITNSYWGSSEGIQPPMVSIVVKIIPTMKMVATMTMVMEETVVVMVQDGSAGRGHPEKQNKPIWAKMSKILDLI